MTRPARPGALLPAVPLAAALVAGFVAVLALADRTAVVVRQCVPGDGVVGSLGVRLSYLRPDSACPDGTLAGDGRHVLSLIVVFALPVLIAHLVGLVVGLGLLAALSKDIRTAVSVVVARLARHLPTAATVGIWRFRVPAHGATWSVVRAGAVVVPWRRGPPALLPA